MAAPPTHVEIGSSALGRLRPINYAGHACLIIRVVPGYDA